MAVIFQLPGTMPDGEEVQCWAVLTFNLSTKEEIAEFGTGRLGKAMLA